MISKNISKLSQNEDEIWFRANCGCGGDCAADIRITKDKKHPECKKAYKEKN